MDMKKQAICQALRAWINQRPGLEFGNDGSVTSYRAEVRSIGRDLQHARELLRAVEHRDSITGDDLEAAFPHAYSGRLTLVPPNSDGPVEGFNGGKYYRLDYCTGQYWPTEYRKAACAVLASALWSRKREDMPSPRGKLKGMTPGDWLRASFRREFGRSIANRWFN